MLLVAAAAVAWLTLAWLLTNVSPVGDASVQLLGILLLGSAVALSAWPLLWYAPTVRARGATAGRWLVAGRRAALVGVVLAVAVTARILGVLDPLIVLFVAGLAVLVEVALWIRR